jgi:hypothetical protein
MTFSLLRSSLSVALLLAAACGGTTIVDHSENDAGPVGDDDDAQAVDSGTCRPLPGCTSSTQCESTDGCNTCDCVNGAWECGDLGCGDDTADAGDCPLAPPSEPVCATEGLYCDYPSDGGACGDTMCTCEQGGWVCASNPCPTPPTPTCPQAPSPETSCAQAEQVCYYDTMSDPCAEMCTCLQSGTWECDQRCGPDSGAEVDAF